MCLSAKLPTGLCPSTANARPRLPFRRNEALHCFAAKQVATSSLLSESHGYGFMEAVRHLADRVGIALPESQSPRAALESNPAERQRQAAEKRQAKRKDRDAFFRVGRAAQRFYVDTLQPLKASCVEPTCANEA